jgi:hypothetical protein
MGLSPEMSYLQRYFPTLLVALPRAARSFSGAFLDVVKRLRHGMTRRGMIALALVAILAVGFATTVALFRRHLALRQRAAYHEEIEKLVTATIGELDLAARSPKAAAQVRANAAIRDRHARLKEKYWRAARYPWLPVEPDPPEPEKPFSLEDLHNIDVPSL